MINMYVFLLVFRCSFLLLYLISYLIIAMRSLKTHIFSAYVSPACVSGNLHHIPVENCLCFFLCVCSRILPVIRCSGNFLISLILFGCVFFFLPVVVQYVSRFSVYKSPYTPNDNEFRVCFCFAYEFITSMCPARQHRTQQNKHEIVLETRSYFRDIYSTHTRSHTSKKKITRIFSSIVDRVLYCACSVFFGHCFCVQLKRIISKISVVLPVFFISFLSCSSGYRL